ncbi:unnamed protein product [Phaedon cochleariae]|uniref:Endonuclease-reverse transcriptase n=1 Tax=Phaedon cochleariae TaxID=80249 RepID=A0A9N9X4X4_PHACE|nr:unnamed protein product [Phaedon cochleariae]
MGEDELQSAVKTLVTKLCTSEDFLNHLTAAITQTISGKFEKEIDELKTGNKKIMKIMREQEGIIHSLVSKQDKYERIVRRRNVRLYGVNETQGEDCARKVIEILNDKMNLNMKSHTIENTYKIGRFEVNKTRPILVKFSNNSYKNYAFSNKKKLKNTRIVMREDLTVDQLQNMKAAIQKIENYGKVWTNFGNVFMK